jgi:hypothetical protein
VTSLQEGLAMPAAPGRRVFLHVGAPKTGTTYLQGILWRNRESLRKAGLDVVGVNRGEHYRAGNDLRDLPFDPADPGLDWTGAWDALAKAAVASRSPNVIVSDEHLASLTPAQVRRAVDSLAPREVHVVYATRNLEGLLPSEWQEYVKHRSPLSYPEWTRRVLGNAERGPGRWFWSVHDAGDVVARWSTAVDPAHVHVLTLPPPGSPKDELWRRFAAVVGVPSEAAVEFDVEENTSLGYAEAELLRRVNQALPAEFPRWHHTGLARDLLATKILAPRSPSGRPELPADLRDALRRRAERSASGLAGSGCDLVGDLASLEVPEEPRPGDPPPTDPEVLAAAVDAVAGLLVQMGRMRDDRRRWERRLRGRMDAGRVARTQARVVRVARRSPRLSRLLDRVRAARSG